MTRAASAAEVTPESTSSRQLSRRVVKPSCPGGGQQLVAVGAVADAPAEAAVEQQYLEHGAAADVAGMAALGAAGALVEGDVAVLGQAEKKQLLGRGTVSRFAVGTELADQTLADHAPQALDTNQGSTPMSSRRWTAETASLVCRVEKTRWPVMAARMAMEAVSPSRISPTAMMSGS